MWISQSDFKKIIQALEHLSQGHDQLLENQQKLGTYLRGMKGDLVSALATMKLQETISSARKADISSELQTLSKKLDVLFDMSRPTVTGLQNFFSAVGIPMIPTPTTEQKAEEPPRFPDPLQQR